MGLAKRLTKVGRKHHRRILQLKRANTKPISMGKNLMDTSRSTITSLNTDINLQNHTDINLQNPMVVTVTTRSLCMADTATTDPSQHMVMIPTVIKSQPMAKNPMVIKRQLTVGTTTTDTSQPMAKNPMVTKRQLMVGTTTTDTSQPMGKIHMVTKSQLTADTITTDTSRRMATIPTVTKNQCMADTKSIVMVILTDTKNPTERSTTPATLIIPSKKSVNTLMLKKTTKHNP